MFKVGDKVFDFQNGWGEVTYVYDDDVMPYPVRVKFTASTENFASVATLSFQEYGKDFTQERPELEYVPFTIEDAELFRDRWVKQDDWTLRITAYDDEDVETERVSITYEEAFDRWTFEDGSKFGKLITK